MENGAESGHQVHILETDGGSFELDEHALARILLNDRVKDMPVVVVAVVGAFRKGKSFLLSFFLRYLQNFGREDWIGAPDDQLKGFEWRGGSQRHTKGIAVWSEVFLVPISEGQEVAVLLMDTQGTFDCKTTAKVQSVIFALSSMVSSVLVYNVPQNIQEDDLQHLHLFTEYGRVAQQEANTEPFQSLLFLVRDWCYPYEANYGVEGGRKVLDERLNISEDQFDDLRELREKIRTYFSKIDCFLMPHPGSKVTTEQSFDGRPSDIDEEFKQQLENLVKWLFAPENLLVKKINLRQITCQEMMAYIQVYVHVFKQGEIPAPESIFAATIEGSNLSAMEKAQDLYITKMLKVWEAEDKVNQEVMLGHHYRLREEALELFENTAKMGGELFAQHYKERLTKAMDKIFDSFATYMKQKKDPFKNIIGSLAFKIAHGVMTAGLGAATIALAAVSLPEIAIACSAAGVVSASMHMFHWIMEKKSARRGGGEESESSAAATNASYTSDNTAQQDTVETFENFVNQERDG